MAQWREVAKAHPSVRDYIRNRRWSRRGDVVAYRPNQAHATFSTDLAGFRHSVCAGRNFGIKECLDTARYGLVMGSSHAFGFGLPSNDKTLASQISAQLGFPFANISFPEADTRTLHAVVMNILYRQVAKPQAIILLTGGDFTRHAFSADADPVFGSRNVEDAASHDDPEQMLEQAAQSTPHALAASALWTRAVITTAKAADVPLVLVDDVTFMEKAQPSATEALCGLGTTGGADQMRRFEHQRRFGESFFAMRRKLSDTNGVALVGLDANDTDFIDEFHYDAPSIERLSHVIAPVVSRHLLAK